MNAITRNLPVTADKFERVLLLSLLSEDVLEEGRGPDGDFEGLSVGFFVELDGELLGFSDDSFITREGELLGFSDNQLLATESCLDFPITR